MDIWGSHGPHSTGEDRPWEHASFSGPMIPISSDLVRKVCKTGFREHTGIGADQWHPRWWAWLSSEGMDALAGLVRYVSHFQHIPSAVRLALYFPMENVTGGFRPIGLLTSVLRLVERVHAEIAEQGEAQHLRNYDRASVGCSAEMAA